MGGAIVATQGACFFPDYTFDEAQGGGEPSSTSLATTAAETVSMVASSSSGGPVEDCFDGVDDDGDGLADCDDPDCSVTTECAPPIPVGWGSFGYVVLAETDPDSPAACPAFSPAAKYEGLAQLTGTGFSCSSCGCDLSVDQTCSLADFDGSKPGVQPFFVRDVPCAVTAATNLVSLSVPASWDLTCSALDAAPAGATCPGGACNQSITSPPAVASGGTCGPHGGALDKSDAAFQLGARACGDAPSLGGCEAGTRCVPRGSTPFGSRTCVGKAGDVACPGGSGFQERHVYFEDLSDDRGCTECHCQGVTGGECVITTSFSTDDGCSTMPPVAVPSGGCADLSGNARVGGRTASVTATPSGGSCLPTPGGGAKTGAVAGVTPTTFCCLE